MAGASKLAENRYTRQGTQHNLSIVSMHLAYISSRNVPISRAAESEKMDMRGKMYASSIKGSASLRERRGLRAQ